MKHVIASIKNSNVTVIVGPPACGKSTLTYNIKPSLPEHNFFHTDDYIKFGFKDSLYKLMEDLKNTKGKIVVEGIQTARLLRKWFEYNYSPDLVIKFEINEKELVSRYRKRERDKEYPFSTAKSIATVFGEYALAFSDHEDNPVPGKPKLDRPTLILIEE